LTSSVKIHRRELLNLFLLWGFLLAACQPVQTPKEVVNTLTPAIQALSPTVEQNLYPSTPEEVIRAFLISYPLDQVYALQYLSPFYVKELDAVTVMELLPSKSEVTGFIIQSGSSSAESERSEILTDVAFSDQSSQIQFNLEIVDGRWVIRKSSVK